MSADDRVAQNVATSTASAQLPHLTATPSLRAWKEASMRRFAGSLPGNAVVVPGCDDRRGSHDLAGIGLPLTSLDLSDGMLAMARCQDPGGDHHRPDLRDLAHLDGTYDTIWAGGCVSHLLKPGFVRRVEVCHALRAVRYRTMKEGDGEHFEDPPGMRYPGGAEAQIRRRDKRFYPYFGRDELITLLQGFELLHEQRVEPSEGGFELWLRWS